MSKAALYIRVSTSYQVDKDSLPFQRNELINYAKYALNIEDVEVFEDAGYSGKNTDRPKYQEMIKRIRQKEFSHLLVWKLDRISRNLIDFTKLYDELKKYKVTFISKNEQFDTSSAMGEAMLRIILVFAELERKLTAERVFSIMLSRAEKGLWNGATVPLGFEWDDEKKFPVAFPPEVEIVETIYATYEKTQSTVKTAYFLNDNNYKTKRDGKWTAKTVNDVLRNPFYIGTYRYNLKNSDGTYKDENEWIIIEDNHPAIIDKERFYKIDKLLKSQQKNSKHDINHVHIFSKILTCGNCGLGMNAGRDNARKDGYRPSRYSCYGNHFDNKINCGNFISDITLLPFVLNYISNFVDLQEKMDIDYSLKDIEKSLLRGREFIDIEGIEQKDLEETYISFSKGFKDNSNFNDDADKIELIDYKYKNLYKEKNKFKIALERLDDLYLFSEESLSKKDYLIKKKMLQDELDNIDTEIKKIDNEQNRKIFNIDLLDRASKFLVAKNIYGKRNINYREVLNSIDKKVLKDFINSIILNIEVKNKRILSITFTNNLKHTFVYKSEKEFKKAPRSKYRYKQFIPDIVAYLNDNDYISRSEVETISGMGRTAAYSILRELEEQNIIEKQGYSVATRYFLVKKETT